MAYDEILAGRLRTALKDLAPASEKKMFGDIAFMLNGNMCCGVINDLLMARVDRTHMKQRLPSRMRGLWTSRASP